MTPRSPRVEHHTWHEVRQMAEAGLVVLIPVATIEQHGPHLPCDVDNLIVQYYCDEVAKHHPDLQGCGPVTMIDDWSRQSETGVEGDPRTASAEKGKMWAEATIGRLRNFLQDFRDHPVSRRRNFNWTPPSLTDRAVQDEE